MSTSTLLLCGGTVLFHEADDHITPLRNTDILIEGDKIAKIGSSIEPPREAKIIDCKGKIISPGFIDTHHHLWQSQLKGRHADETLLDYFPTGNMQCYSYTPEDMYWGQLGGCLEALDAGTTFVVDHAHGIYSPDHATKALSATASSGLRAMFCYCYIPIISEWDKEKITLTEDLMPEWAGKQIEHLASQQPFGDGRVNLGFGFDYFWLPKEVVVPTIERIRGLGIKLITSHVGHSAVIGAVSTAKLLKEYNLLGRDFLAAHGTGLTEEEKQIFSAAGIYISSTPDTEAQMAMGWPTAFEPGVLSSLGIDCHSSNTSSIPAQMHLALQLARQRANQPFLDKDQFPLRLVGSVEQAFNLGTICGARAVNMEDRIGSIAEGKLADLVVFDTGSSSMVCAAEHDPVVAVVRHSSVRDVECVIVGGRIVKEGGTLVDVGIEAEIDGGGDVSSSVVAQKWNPKKPVVGWKDVAAELVRSRAEIQTRIDGLNLEKAKEYLMKAWYMDPKAFV